VRAGLVVLDLGDVLVPSGGVLPTLAAELGVTGEELAAAYWPHRHAYDLGGDEGAYWRSVFTLLGREPEPSLVRRISGLDASKWSLLPPSGHALLGALAGLRLAVLSNAPLPLAEAVRRAPWSAAADVLVFSAEVGLAKPDPRIYARADAEYGTEPHEVVFFDDRADNVAAARAHGWAAHVWTPGMTADDVLAATR
jgi:putative hydrolase of the HAD superfamily